MSARFPPTPGVDSPQLPYALTAKLNVARDDPVMAARALGSILELIRELGLALPQDVGQDCASGTAVIGFSARFFRGVLDPELNRRSESWGFDEPPRCLKTMHARGDEHFPAVATLSALARCESDLLVVVETAKPMLRVRVEQALVRLDGESLQVRDVTDAFVAKDGRDATGYLHGTSNLAEVRRDDPDRYRAFVYIADEPRYRGDTYLAYRKYRVNLERWRRPSYALDVDGATLVGDAARDATIGRTASEGRVVDRESGRELEGEYDAAEGGRAFERSHVRHTNPRGRGRTQFGDEVHTRDVRLLRRSFSFRSRGTNVPDGLLFLAFQSDIQRGGFEFVNNEWIMAGGFLGGKDALLDPTRGLVEVVDGCYYFVPVVTPVEDVVALESVGSAFAR